MPKAIFVKHYKGYRVGEKVRLTAQDFTNLRQGGYVVDGDRVKDVKVEDADLTSSHAERTKVEVGNTDPSEDDHKDKGHLEPVDTDPAKDDPVDDVPVKEEPVKEDPKPVEPKEDLFENDKEPEKGEVTVEIEKPVKEIDDRAAELGDTRVIE